MKKVLFLLITIMVIFSCTAPSSDSTKNINQTKPSTPPAQTKPGTPLGDPDEPSSSVSPDNPQTPPVTGELSDFLNTIYAGERRLWKEGEPDRYMYLIFSSAIEGKKLPVKIGTGLTFDQAKEMAMSNKAEMANAAVNVPFIMQLSNKITIYMDNDLKGGHTTGKIIIGNEVFHHADAMLKKQ